MCAIASQITSLTIVYSIVIETQLKENIKAPRHWPLCGEITGDRLIPRTVTRQMCPFDDVIMKPHIVPSSYQCCIGSDVILDRVVL